MKKALVLVLILTFIFQPLALAEIDDYVSHPGNIPDFHKFNTPQLEPGESGIFSADVSNRYNETITNTTIIAEIYYRADIDESEPIEKIDNNRRPYITEQEWKSTKNSEEMVPTDTKKTIFEISNLESNETISINFKINTNEDTKEGTYFVRFSMDFEHNGTLRKLESRGHWNMETWENATTNVTDGSPGNINLEILEVDGIIPDSSFSIKKSIPNWPLYLLVTLTVFFATLSVIFYLEEEGTYPQLNKWLQKQRGKFNQLRLRFKYRKGS